MVVGCQLKPNLMGSAASPAYIAVVPISALLPVPSASAPPRWGRSFKTVLLLNVKGPRLAA